VQGGVVRRAKRERGALAGWALLERAARLCPGLPGGPGWMSFIRLWGR
jgi:hypothetical protein